MFFKKLKKPSGTLGETPQNPHKFDSLPPIIIKQLLNLQSGIISDLQKTLLIEGLLTIGAKHNKYLLFPQISNSESFIIVNSPQEARPYWDQKNVTTIVSPLATTKTTVPAPSAIKPVQNKVKGSQNIITPINITNIPAPELRILRKLRSREEVSPQLVNRLIKSFSKKSLKLRQPFLVPEIPQIQFVILPKNEIAKYANQKNLVAIPVPIKHPSSITSPLATKPKKKKPPTAPQLQPKEIIETGQQLIDAIHSESSPNSASNNPQLTELEKIPKTKQLQPKPVKNQEIGETLNISRSCRTYPDIQKMHTSKFWETKLECNNLNFKANSDCSRGWAHTPWNSSDLLLTEIPDQPEILCSCIIQGKVSESPMNKPYQSANTAYFIRRIIEYYLPIVLSKDQTFNPLLITNIFTRINYLLYVLINTTYLNPYKLAQVEDVGDYVFTLKGQEFNYARILLDKHLLEVIQDMKNDPQLKLLLNDPDHFHNFNEANLGLLILNQKTNQAYSWMLGKTFLKYQGTTTPNFKKHGNSLGTRNFSYPEVSTWDIQSGDKLCLNSIFPDQSIEEFETPLEHNKNLITHQKTALCLQLLEILILYQSDTLQEKNSKRVTDQEILEELKLFLNKPHNKELNEFYRKDLPVILNQTKNIEDQGLLCTQINKTSPELFKTLIRQIQNWDDFYTLTPLLNSWNMHNNLSIIFQNQSIATTTIDIK